ncbi:MAG: hypothetical protein QF752_14665 [Planctomycetota bacterium]|jgi:Tfp pilus assembly protein FimT|nr:hypothetical protein [Planctomycetota bacterium]
MLIELLIGLIILSGMLTLVYSSMDSLTSESRLESTTRDIASELESALSESIVTGAEHILVYELDDNEYWLLGPEDETSVQIKDKQRNEESRRLELPVFGEGVQLAAVALSKDKIVKRGQVRIRISPMGTVTAHAVHLIHTEGGKMTVRIGTLGGTIDVLAGHEIPYDIEVIDEN